MIPNKLRILIEKLLEKTDKNEILWNKSSSSNGFLLVLDSSSVSLDRYQDGFESVEIQLRIFNDVGEIVEVLSVSNQDDHDEFKLLDDLHNVVRRRYLRADETIDIISKELSRPGQVGKKAKSAGDSDESDDLPF